MKLNFSNCFTIECISIKYLTEVMHQWNLQCTVIWDRCLPSHWKFILRLHHRCLDQSKWAPHPRFRKMFQIIFVVFVHCDIPYPVLHWNSQQVVGGLINSRLILLYPYVKNLIIQLVLFHWINITIWKRNELPSLILNFKIYLPSHGNMILSVISKILLICHGIKIWTNTPIILNPPLSWSAASVLP